MMPVHCIEPSTPGLRCCSKVREKSPMPEGSSLAFSDEV